MTGSGRLGPDGARTSGALAWRRSALGVLAVCGGSAVLVLAVTAHEWFHSDEWDFVSHRMGHGLGPVLAPHNQHPSMIPVLLWRVLFRFAAARQYWPYELSLVLACAVLVTLVWLVARRCGAGPVAALAAASMLAFCGAGQQDMLSAFQFSFVGSVVGTWAATLLADDRRSGAVGSWRRMVCTWSAILGGLACSLVAVPLLVVPVGVAWARGGRRRAAVTAAVPVTLLVVWYARYDAGTSSGAPPAQLHLIPDYVARGLLSIGDGLTGVPYGGVACLVLVALAIVLRLLSVRPAAVEFPAVLGLVATVPFYLVASAGRTGLGADQAATSRYVYIGVALTLPAVAVVASRAGAWLRRAGTSAGRLRVPVGATAVATVGALLAVAAVDVRGSVLLVNERTTILGAAGTIRTRFGTALFLLESGQQLIGTADVYPSLPDGSPTYPSDLLQLRRDRAFGALPVGAGEALAKAQAALQLTLVPIGPAAPGQPSVPSVAAVGLDRAEPVPDRPLLVAAVTAGALTRTRRGCAELTPRDREATVVLRTPEGGGQAIVGVAPRTAMQIGVETGVAGPGAPYLRPAFLSAAGRYRLLSTDASGRVLVSVRAAAEICGIVSG